MPTHVPNTTLYNKHLAPPHNTCEVPDSPGGRISGEAMIAESHGAWDWAPLPSDPEPGIAVSLVEFEPVKPKSQPKPSTSSKGS